MMKDKPTNKELTDKLMEWWDGVLTAKRDDGKPLSKRKPELLKLSVEFEDNEAWCLKWFSHMTYNLFDSQEEAFNSFHRFVQEKLPLHRNQDLPEEYRVKNKLKTYCLMGAEDSWRWEICGCDKCKAEGMTIIKH